MKERAWKAVASQAQGLRSALSAHDAQLSHPTPRDPPSLGWTGLSAPTVPVHRADGGVRTDSGHAPAAAWSAQMAAAPPGDPRAAAPALFSGRSPSPGRPLIWDWGVCGCPGCPAPPPSPAQRSRGSRCFGAAGRPERRASDRLRLPGDAGSQADSELLPAGPRRAEAPRGKQPRRPKYQAWT